jgi:hypothetical protein
MQRLLLSLVAAAVLFTAQPAEAGLGTSPSLGPVDAGVVDAGGEADAGPRTRADVEPDAGWVFDLDQLLLIAGLLYGVVSAVVAMTPTKADDAWLARWAQRLSFLRPPNAAPGLFGRLPLLGRLSLPGTRPQPREGSRS